MESASAIAVAARPVHSGRRITAPAFVFSLTLHGAVAAAALWWPLSEKAPTLSAPAVEIVFWAAPSGTETPAPDKPVETAAAPPPSAAPATPETAMVEPSPPEEPALRINETATEIVEPPPQAKPAEPKPRRVARTAPTPSVERPPETPLTTKPTPHTLEAATATGTAESATPVPLPAAAAPAQLAAVPLATEMSLSPPVITQARFRSPPLPPAYPRRAVDLGQEGEVIIRALVGIDGESREIRIFRSSGVALLDDAALRAVRRWAFEAAQINGRAIEAWVEVPVRFQLRTVL